jgi:hypothetical protein
MNSYHFRPDAHPVISALRALLVSQSIMGQIGVRCTHMYSCLVFVCFSSHVHFTCAQMGPAACLPLCLPGCLPASLSARLPACLAVCLAACLPLFQPGCLPACLSFSLAACLPPFQPGCLPASLSARLPACLSFSPAACLPPFQPGCLPAALSARLPACFSACCKPFARAASFAFCAFAHKSKREAAKP